jgi:hypothetical protein
MPLDPGNNVDPRTSPSEPVPEEPMLFCPVCSLKLQQRKCKLFCSQCGYYMSCADYI